VPSVVAGVASSSVKDYAKVAKPGLVMYLDAGYLASYPASGTAWTDLSGSGFNSTLVNGVGYTADNKGALVFDGVDDHCSLGTQFMISTTTPFTVQMWLRLDPRFSPSVVFHRMLTLRASGTGVFGMAYASSASNGYNGLYIVSNSGWVRATTGFHPTPNVWGFYSLTYNGAGATTLSNFSLSWDNSNVPMSSEGTALPGATADVNFIGIRQQPTDNQWYRGRMGLVSIYNRVLSPAETTQNFNALRTRYGI
jgi:hypothetical protein